MIAPSRANWCLLFDLGDTLMRVLGYSGLMADWPRVEVIPHAVEVLTELRPHWLLALATNAESAEVDIRRALQRGDLNHLIDRVYCFRAIGHRKPSARFFEYIADDLQLDGAHLVMVGDDFEMDVLGATQAGLYAIWFNEHSCEEQTGQQHRTIHNLRELPTALAALLADQV